MNEQLLQFIWRFQYFNRSRLFTVNEMPVEVMFPGLINTNQGPDFSNAKIKIKDTVWAGTVELHLRTSDWLKHKHAVDNNYKNVILHVVYENDIADQADLIPVLELKDRIAVGLLSRYRQLMETRQFIPCENLVTGVPELTIVTWKERLLINRLQRKVSVIENYLLRTSRHWEMSFWWLLAKSFGTKTNAEIFEAVAESIPLNILVKHKHQLIQLEALLLGQAGLLNGEFNEAYPKLLQREYRFLKTKYQLLPVVFPVHFLRMRPGNFPTIRLAQLAALIFHSVHLFSKIVAEEALSNVRRWFKVTPNDYWNYHYTLTDAPCLKPKPVGDEMINSVLINTVVPMLFTYGQLHQAQKIKDRSLKWLEQIKAESNVIIKGFKKTGFKCLSAWDSQALIELKTQYCDHRLCLNCSIGNSILK
ncbi:MAG: DUF2851 family protein [Niabella sp.]